ncbi:NEDD8-specific protease 1-like [Silene latifolia]|uniref:NEDD8-specific protease 1-like n=1 Tax=Silene latifolia TaxID=37657 RepID=UPI003D76CEDA
MSNGEVFKYKDILRESDLDPLKNKSCFLTEDIIAFYFRYLSSLCKTDDIMLLLPSESFSLANYEDDNGVSTFAENEKLSTKRLVVFPVNDCYDFSEGDRGSHWSVLVYSRSMNAFLHFDSIAGTNNLPAEKLYEAVKKYIGVGGQVPSAALMKKQKNKNKKASAVSQPVSKPCQVVANAAAPDGLPVFKEAETPQQTNTIDCGIYVLAIVKAIIDCFGDGSDSNTTDVPSVVATDVHQSIESTMRTEILELVNNLRKNVIE